MQWEWGGGGGNWEQQVGTIWQTQNYQTRHFKVEMKVEIEEYPGH